MPLDNPTRVGLGGTAAFTLAGFAAPLLGWEIAGPIMAVCAGVAIWGFWPLVRPYLPSKENLKRALRFAIVLLIGVCIGWLASGKRYASFGGLVTGPIVWNFEDTARGNGYFLDIQKQPGNEIVVAGFGAHGKNTTSEPINDFDGYLRSDRNNETLPIYILAANAAIANACTLLVPTLPKDTLGIPAFADFNISTSKKPIVLNHFEGFPLSQFVNEFVPFTIVMEYSGKKYQRHFTKNEVDRQVAMLEKLAGPPPNPYVIRKSTAPAVTIAPPPLTPLITPKPWSPPANPDLTGTVLGK